MSGLGFQMGQEHPCSYLPGRIARSLYAMPQTAMHMALYSELAAWGFRRSGDLAYRPACRDCSACVPVRMAVEDFKPNRSQSRVWRRNADLRVTAMPAQFDEEHYQLFTRYLQSRHGDGGMSDTSRDEYTDFLTAGWAQTRFVEFRLGESLLAVAVVDCLADGLSAVYTFFDPDQGERSLGVYAVLWQVEEARRLQLQWLYLGFWIGDCRKMAYKSEYRPLQALIEGHWRVFEKGEMIRI